MRLFAAVFIPKEISAEIYSYSEAAAKYCEAKAVTAGNMHITLNFFGDADPEQCAKIVEKALRGVKSFELSIKGIDFFSYGKYAGVLWAGVTDAGFLEKIALDTGNIRKKYMPHITLARFKNDTVQNEVISGYLNENALRDKYFGGFSVKKIVLAESVLSSGAAEYKTVKEFVLGE